MEATTVGGGTTDSIMVLLIIDDDKYKLHLAGQAVRHLKNAIKQREDISLCVDDPRVVFQLWDTDFEEFVNIPNSFNSIPNKARIKIKWKQIDNSIANPIVEVKREAVANDENSGSGSSYFSYQPNLEIDFSGAHLQDEQISQPRTSVENHVKEILEKSDSTPYRLPEFSSRMQAVLAQRTVPTQLQRKWIIEELFHNIVQYTWFPGDLYQHATTLLVHQYPHLRDPTGNGYESWLNQLRNKFANERRKERMVVMYGTGESRKRPMNIINVENTKKFKNGNEPNESSETEIS